VSAFADILRRGDVRDYRALEKMGAALLAIDDASSEREAVRATRQLEKAVTALRKRINNKVARSWHVHAMDRLTDLEALMR
jgi:hypothetical protein